MCKLTNLNLRWWLTLSCFHQLAIFSTGHDGRVSGRPFTLNTRTTGTLPCSYVEQQQGHIWSSQQQDEEQTVNTKWRPITEGVGVM